VYVVLRGSGRMKIDDDIVDLGEGDMVRVSPGVWRCTEAGPDGLELLAVGAPVADENDAETAPGWWPADDAADA
jgi:mannose-6-phosphate isomerase-like protein (cupin superfamily)